MAVKGIVIPPTSPWRFYDYQDANGGQIYAEVSWTGAWDATTALTGATVFRDPNCLYHRVIIGSINPDGSLPAGTRTVNVPAGTTTFNAAQLSAVGLNTIGDVQNAPQITVSP